jgi:multicomponent Na+:H+ antiporter subunit E
LLHAVSLGASLFGLWVVLSGHSEPLLLGFGLLSAGFVLFIALRMDIADHEGHPIHLNIMALGQYWVWLLKEIVKANLDVTRRVLRPSLPISPTIVSLETTQRSDVGRVIHANSITLTPGTVSIDVEGTIIEVHCLSKEAAQGMQTGEMDRRVTEIEGRS